MDFQSALDRWVADPGPATLAPLLDEIQAQPNYVVSPDFSDAAHALLRRDYAESVERLEARMPGAFLSPTAHDLLAQAYDGRFREADAVRERAFARLALVTILTSGTGTFANPWKVLRISDEYDILIALEEHAHEQLSDESSDRLLDRITTTAGNTYWFELWRGGRSRSRTAA